MSDTRDLRLQPPVGGKPAPIRVRVRYRPRPGAMEGLADLVLELLDERRRSGRG